ncbi:MAG: tetratricopeptide repeat protein [Candidatus Zixiibacteriota bacterium]
MMLVEYILIFVLLLAVTTGLYALIDRFFEKKTKSESVVYVDALRDLLDGRVEAAFAKLRQAVSEDSENLDAYLRLGQILREHGKPERALQVHKDLTLRGNLKPAQKAAVLQQLATDYLDLKNFDMAEAAVKELLQYDANHRWGHARLLEIQQKGEKWEEAYDTAVALLKSEANKSKKPLAVFKFKMGMVLYKKREYHKARVLFKEALGLDPKYVEAYIAIGDSYTIEGRQEDAVAFWQKLLEEVPEEGHQVLDRLQKTLYELGRFGDIENICQRIITQAPDDIYAKLTLANIYKKKGELDAAERLLAEVVELKSDDVNVVMQLVRLYLEKRENQKLDRLFRMVEKNRRKPPTPTGKMPGGALTSK